MILLIVCIFQQGRLDLDRISICGHSFGGGTSILAMSMDPRFKYVTLEVVQGIVVVVTVCLTMNRTSGRPEEQLN